MYSKLFQLHSKLLKSLAHSKRLEILQLIREHSLTVGQIQEMLDLPQANLSQHLQILRESGVVKTKRNGKHIYYSIGHRNFIKASDLFREILIENNNDEISDVAFKKMTDLVPLTQDPVCKMRISPKAASFVHKIKGHEYYFCGSGCLKKFKLNTKIYINTIKK
ncbi:MAG: metalloregulator ArsR/SmtB family transcription factor [Patescibacteria group bacterium]